jgi:hypothetical protein
METQRRLERITTTFSLVGLALGFSLLGILTLVNRQSQGASIAGGFIDILLGTSFLRSAFTFKSTKPSTLLSPLVRQAPVHEELERMVEHDWKENQT